LYVAPLPEDVIASVLAHHRRSVEQGTAAGDEPAVLAEAGYRPESLDVLFGHTSA
jgi:hypothetical protein